MTGYRRFSHADNPLAAVITKQTAFRDALAAAANAALL